MANQKLVPLLIDADRIRDRQDWDALLNVSKKIAKTVPDQAAAYDALFNGEVALQKALAAWYEAHRVDYSNDELPKISSQKVVPLENLEPARKFLESCNLDDAKILLAQLRFESGNPAMDVLKSISKPPNWPNVHVLYLQAQLVKALILNKMNQTQDALEALEQIAAFARENRSSLERGSYTLKIVEEALFRIPFLYPPTGKEDQCRATFKELLDLPHCYDTSKRISSLFNYASLIQKSYAFEQLRSKPRQVEEVVQFKDEAAVLLSNVPWLLTIRGSVSMDSLSKAYFISLEILDVIAALPALVKAYEIGMCMFHDHHGLVFLYGRALIHSDRHREALSVVRSSMGDSEVLHWMAAWLCLVPLSSKHEQVLEYAERGLQLGSKYSAKFHHAIAIANERLATECNMLLESINCLLIPQNTATEIVVKQQFKREALVHLKEAKLLDSENWEIEYHLAVHFAQKRKINTAIHHVKAAIALNEHNPELWNFFVLLCSANRDYESAQLFCQQGLERHRNNLSLLLTWALLEGHLHGLQRELAAIKSIFAKLGSDKGSELDVNVLGRHASFIGKESRNGTPKRRNTTIGRASRSSRTSSYPDPTSPTSSKTNSLFAPNLSRPTSVQQISELNFKDAFSDKGSITSGQTSSSHFGNVSVVDGYTTQQEHVRAGLLWVCAGRAYLRQGNADDALVCMRSAIGVEAALPEAWCLYGDFCELQGLKDYEETLSFYSKALALDYTFVPALVGSARILLKVGRIALAHQYLTSAVNLDEHDASAWLALGQVYKALGDVNTASECLLRSFNEERNTPVRPFRVHWTLKTGTEAWQL